MLWRRSHRASLVLSLCALSMLGCTPEEDGVGLTGKIPKPGTSAANGTVAPGGDDTPGATPTPSPTPSSAPVLPTGFEVNNGYSTGSVAIVRPQAVGISGTGDVYVASAPLDSRDLTKPYLLTVMSTLGTLKASASVSVLPMTFAFYGTQCFLTDGRKLLTLDASLNVVSEVEYYAGTASSMSFAMSVSYPGKPLIKAVGLPQQVIRYPADYPAAGAPDPRAFSGGVPACLAFEPYKALWAAGGQKLVKIPELAADDASETAVTDLGTLTSMAVQPTGDVWLLGTSKLALYDSAGVRKSGPFNYGGDRVLLRTGNKPVVVNYSTGQITRLNTDGSLDTTSGTTGLAQVTLAGGLNGAALDANGNLWVSSKVHDYAAHTRF